MTATVLAEAVSELAAASLGLVQWGVGSGLPRVRLTEARGDLARRHDGVPAPVCRARREDAVVPALHALAPSLDGEPDPAFREATRARLVAMAAVRSPAPPPSRLRRLLSLRAADAAPVRWRARVTAGLAGAPSP